MTPTILFDLPQREIASLISDRMARASEFSMVTGFATPGGFASISGPVQTHPHKLRTLVIGAATYPGFEALDDLLAAGVPPDRLYVHLGHSSETGGRKNPFARFRPMLHSKVYYMEMPGGAAAAFIGSHNLTAFALTGLNGEAAVLLEGPSASLEFHRLREHIANARSQSVAYNSTMKEAYAWWTREYIEGMKAEVRIPQDWTTIRTILLFASAERGDRPKRGDHLYFEIPAGIEQIESLKTETHLFLFDTLPADPWEALERARSADALYTCVTLGAENKQGNREVVAHWRIDGQPRPVLARVPGATYRPSPPAGMQQVRAEIEGSFIEPFDYLFERESVAWDPEFDAQSMVNLFGLDVPQAVQLEARGRNWAVHSWKLVKGLSRRAGSPREKDAAALMLAAPESGSFILVSLRRRKRSESKATA